MSRESQQSQRGQQELAKIARTQIAFKIGGLTEQNFDYAQQEIQAVRTPSPPFLRASSLTRQNQLVRQSPPDTDLFLLSRLLSASLTALGFPTSSSSTSLSLTPSSTSPAQSALALRLLQAEIRRLARDPWSAPRFAEALSHGLSGAPGASSGGAEEAFSVRTFIQRMALSPLETVILFQPVVAVPSMGAPSPSGPSPPPGLGNLGGPANLPKRKEIAKEAVDVLRETLPAAIASLGKPVVQGHTTDDQLAELNPVQLSKLVSSLVSDVVVVADPPDGPAGEDGGRDKEEVLLWSTSLQRQAVGALESRVGTDLAAQIAAHCLGEAKFIPSETSPTPPTNPVSVSPGSNLVGPSAIELLHRLCPDTGICSTELVRTVLSRFSTLTASTTPGEAEDEAASQLRELVDLATATGGEVGLDHVAWMRGVGELCIGLKWSEVVRKAWDFEGAPNPETWGLRMLGKVMSLAPSHNPAETVGVVPADTANTAGVKGLFGTWHHPNVQISLIDRLTYLPFEASPFQAGLKSSLLAPMLPAPLHPIVTVEDAQGASPTIRGLAKTSETSQWNVLELVVTIARLLGAGEGQGAAAGDEVAQREVREKATEVMERACKSNPELVMMALIRVEVSRSMLEHGARQRLMCGYDAATVVDARVGPGRPAALVLPVRPPVPPARLPPALAD